MTRRVKELQCISPELLESLINKYAPETRNPNIALQNQHIILKKVLKDRKALMLQATILQARAEAAEHRVRQILKLCASTFDDDLTLVSK